MSCDANHLGNTANATLDMTHAATSSAVSLLKAGMGKSRLKLAIRTDASTVVVKTLHNMLQVQPVIASHQLIVISYIINIQYRSIVM